MFASIIIYRIRMIKKKVNSKDVNHLNEGEEKKNERDWEKERERSLSLREATTFKKKRSCIYLKGWNKSCFYFTTAYPKKV